MTEEDKTTPSVPEQLTSLAETFREKNAAYGESFRQVGKVLMGLFPEGLEIKTEEEWNRLATFLHIIDKSIRYANNIKKGGHADSLDDIAVYSQILQMLDEEEARK
jgi:hypothetical protein